MCSIISEVVILRIFFVSFFRVPPSHFVSVSVSVSISVSVSVRKRKIRKKITRNRRILFLINLALLYVFVVDIRV